MFSITPGSSWPFGGPVITSELAMQCAIPYQIDVHGPCVYSEDLTTRIYGEVAGAVMGKMENYVMLPDTVRDISESITDKYLFNWPWGLQIEPLEIPEGDWKHVLFIIHRYRHQVSRPVANAHGSVLDHGNRKAVDLFFSQMVQPIADVLVGLPVHSYFCDSIECDGHNWSAELLKEFEARRGYSLTPWLYALWGDMGEATWGIRYDYFLTMSELTLENFFELFSLFSREHGSQSRVQAHGTWGDILKVYASADIPEGETFGAHTHYACNSIHRRMAASAGHIYGKPIISNESFTWLALPRFTETPELLKAAVDAVFLDGINQIANHGYTYAPPDDKPTDHAFYASNQIGHISPWFRHYAPLGEYIHCVSALLRVGEPYAEVAVYLPQGDVWSANKLSDIHLAMRLEEHIGCDIADAINRQGDWFDYLNDEALTSLSRVTANGLSLPGGLKRMIVLVDCFRIPLDSAQILFDFAKAGGLLVVAGCMPQTACGLQGQREDGARVKNLFERLRSDNLLVYVEDKYNGLLPALQSCMAPELRIEKNDTVGYVHRKDGNTDLYFVANVGPAPVRTQLHFRENMGTVALLDPIKGTACSCSSEKSSTDSTMLELDLEAYGSNFLLCGPEIHKADPAKIEKIVHAFLLQDISLTIEGREVAQFEQEAQGWEKYAAYRFFSGCGSYTAQLEVLPGQAYDRAELELERLSASAEVRVNGQSCGCIWKRPYVADISKALIVGHNTIEIIVANCLINQAIDPENTPKEYPPLMDAWPYMGSVLNDVQKRRNSTEKERQQVKLPVFSGIEGGVEIRLLHTV